MPRYNYICEEHGVFSEIVSYSYRETPQECPKCLSKSPRTWEGHSINYATASLPDGNGRFNNLREISRLRKEKAAARAKKDLASADKISREIKKVTQ